MGQYITFRIARQDFAMDTTRLRGLLPAYDLITLDPPSGWILGIASVRGIDFPVIDVRGKLGIAHGSQGRQPCIIVVEVASETGPQMVGFIADRVSDVITIRKHEIREGVIRTHGRPRRIFDPDVLAGEMLPATIVGRE